MDYIVQGILQARILDWVAIPCSRESSQPRDMYVRVESTELADELYSMKEHEESEMTHRVWLKQLGTFHLLKCKRQSAEQVLWKAIVPSHDSRARTRSPSPRAWRPDFPGAAREAP